jgi:hypothetical protein
LEFGKFGPFFFHKKTFVKVSNQIFPAKNLMKIVHQKKNPFDVI